VRTLPPGVVSATFSGIKYSSSLLETSYGSKEDSPDPEADAEGRRL